MTFLAYLAVYVILFIAAELLRPKPEIEDARPSGLSDFNFPTATEGRAVPLLWGTVATSSPNVIWYGDLRTERIRDKIKTGMFSSKKVTVGYKYYIGMQFGLCRGPMDATSSPSGVAAGGLLKILIDDEVLWDSGSPEVPVNNGSFTVNEPEFFGKDNGGMSGTFTMFPGTDNQARSTYLEGAVTFSPDILPAYRGTAYLVAEQIYIGNSPSLKPIKFVIRRIPDGLALGADAIINTRDANPMNVLYEILTNNEWGLSQGAGDVDIATLSTIGAQLATEGNGFSAMLDAEKKVEDVIKEIERQCAGVLYRDINTGQYTFRLIRETDIPSPISLLPAVDEANCKKLEFSRGAWSETTNIVRVRYADPDKNYQTSFGLAQDMANWIIQQGPVITTENFMGVKNKSLANYLAWRDLRNLAQPVAKAKMVVNRELYSVVPGDLIRVSWDLFGLSDFLMRVTKVNYGELLNNKITIDAVEDIFTQQAASFGDPIDSSWSAPTQTVTAEDPEDQVLIETPRLMQIQDPDNPTLTPRVSTLVRLTGSYGDEYSILTDTATGKAAATSGAMTENDTVVPGFMIVGTLRTALNGPADGPGNQGTVTVYVDPIGGGSLADVVDTDALTTSEMGDLKSLIYICPATFNSPDDLRDFGEFFIYNQAVSSVGGSPQLTGLRLDYCYRGALDTAPQAWPAGSLVFFVSLGGAGISSESFLENYYVAAKILPYTQESGQLGSASAPYTNVIRIHDGFRSRAPLAPTELKLNSNFFWSSLPLSISTQYFIVQWTRRNWRTNHALYSVQGKNDDTTTFNPGGADAGDQLSYIIRIFDISSPNLGSPNLIYEDETAADDVNNYFDQVWTNDIWGMIVNPESARLRVEIWARHIVDGVTIDAREPLWHEFNLTESSAANDYTAATYLGRIPYGTVVSPGKLVDKAGSPGSPKVVPKLTIRFARGARIDEGSGTGEQGKVYLLDNDGSPAQLIYDASTVSPDTQYVFQNIVNGSPSNWQGHTINILHYHVTGRPVFFHIVDTATEQVYAWGVLEPNTSTVPAPGAES